MKAHLVALWIAVPGLTGLGGCAAGGGPVTAGGPRPGFSPRDVAVFDASSGSALGWEELLSRIAAAEIVILGEQHDDAEGHAVQLALVADAMARWPEGAALSLEMLERDEQHIVDDYLDGIIDAEQLATLTHSTRWAGEGSWRRWYQPVIDAARDAEARVVAANAPRRYARLARTDGYARLDALPPARRALVDHPGVLPEGDYRDRFFSLMAGAHGPGQNGTGVNADETRVDDAEIEAFFRSQCVWDTTMASSIAAAMAGRTSHVIHLVGQFHSDFDGGLVQELRRLLPGAYVLAVSLRPGTTRALLEDDRGRADIVIYTE